MGVVEERESMVVDCVNGNGANVIRVLCLIFDEEEEEDEEKSVSE